MTRAQSPSAYGAGCSRTPLVAAGEQVPQRAHRSASVRSHTTDEELCSLVADFLFTGLSQGSPVIILATPEHRRQLMDRLAALGVNVAAARDWSTVIDASDAFATFMLEQRPDAERFRTQFATWLETAPGIERPVFIYSELMDLLWRDDRRSAAVLLEEMWAAAVREAPMEVTASHTIAGMFKVLHGGARTSDVAVIGDGACVDSSPQQSPIELALRQAVRELCEREENLAESHAALRRLDAAARTERLMKVTAAMADAVDPPEVLSAVVDRVGEALKASSLGLWLLSDDGQHIELARSIGYSDAARAKLESISLEVRPTVPVVDAMLAREPLWIASQPELLRSYPHLTSLATPGRAYGIACLPLLVQGHLRGCLGFTFDDERLAVQEERDLLLLVARYSGQAIERLRLLATERTSRTQAESAAARLSLLSGASRVFAEASQRRSALFPAIVRHVTADYADGCYIALVASDTDILKLVAFHHRDPQLFEQISDALRVTPPRIGRSISGHVAASGRSILMPVVQTEESQRALGEDDRAWLEHSSVRTLVIVPLCIAGKVTGILCATRHAAGRPFSREDLELFEELADRASVAIEAARLHEANEEARARAELLYELAAAVIRAKTVEEVFDAALAGIERALGASRCAILVFDAAGVMRFTAWRGLSDKYRAAVEGHSPWDRHAQHPQPVVVANVHADPALSSYAPLFQSEGIGALSFIPLVWEQRLIGKFMVYYPAPRELSPAELDMAQAIANHIASAIGRFSALAELQQTVRFNEIFTGMLGHDLRNPLGAIMAGAQIAIRRSDSEQITRPLSRILSSGARMARMIDQLLDFTRVRVGAGIPIDARETDALSILRQVLDELRDAHPSCELRLDVRGDHALGVWDADRIYQVFSNLIANAIQHGEAESAVIVSVTTEPKDQILVCIHNDGVIPTEVLPRLFEPMAGGDRRRQHSRGLGLGLYISREIVKAHGGRIDVDTQPAKGTTFSVRLPRGRSEKCGASA